MKSLKQIARRRLQALGADPYLQGWLQQRRIENLLLMGWRPPAESPAEAVVPAEIPCEDRSPVNSEPPEVILRVEHPVVTQKRERNVKTTDKIELLLILGLLFGVGTAVLLVCMSVAILFFSSGAVSAGGAAPTVLP